MSAAASPSYGSAPRSPRVAFFGGSFDPPHCGHLGIAHAARQALALDTVLFAPVGRQPLKTDQILPTDFAHRVSMTRLAIADEPGFRLSLLDAPTANGEPNFTASTLERLRAELPHAAELFLLIGSDSLAQFPRWHRAAEIPFMASLIVAARPGAFDPKSMTETGLDQTLWLPDSLRWCESSKRQEAPGLTSIPIADFTGRETLVYFLDEPDYPVSATRLRALLAQHADDDVSDLLPPGVLDYIRTHRLYVSSGAHPIAQ